MQLANFLKVPVMYFFEDYPGYIIQAHLKDKIVEVDRRS